MGLLDMSGFEVCCSLCMFSEVLVIFLIVCNDEFDWVFGLELGVDDYMVKLFLFCELVVWVWVWLWWVGSSVVFESVGW